MCGTQRFHNVAQSQAESDKLVRLDFVAFSSPLPQAPRLDGVELMDHWSRNLKGGGLDPAANKQECPSKLDMRQSPLL
jgi:hypothetical protein